MSLTGNKGEWSEIYTLFKLLGDKELYSGDADLNKIETLFYPIIKIIRNESGGNYEYELKGDIVFITGDKDIRIPVRTFQEKAAFLLGKIRKANGAFSIPELDDFLRSVNCQSLKAKSTKKSDIRIVIHDSTINKQAELGFSIKSQLGGDSTLLNAGKTTNFIFQIENLNPSDAEVTRINSIDSRSKIKDRIEELKRKGGYLRFVGLENEIFKNNLVLIDSYLPNILAETVKSFYTTILNSIKDLCESINERNPLNYDKTHFHSFYEYKIKRFLTDVALGMMPSKVWGGIYDATGGYLVVKENGEVLCYHIYNRNQFEDYLFHNTRLETASSTRHEFGVIYENNGKWFFKLNLQIRFI